MASAAAVVASQVSKENPSIRLTKSKTLNVFFGSLDEELKIDTGDLHPKIPSRPGEILLEDDTMEMRLNGVMCLC